MKKFYTQHKKKIHTIGLLAIAKWIIVALIGLIIAYYAKPTLVEELEISIIGPADISTPVDFNVSKYMGTWYEVARYNHSFEEGCECVTANYALMNDYVSVENTCLKNGEFSTAKAKAYTTLQPGVLNVQFIPFINGDYRVVYVDKDYENAIVSNRVQTSLWFLSKNPDENTANELRAIANAKHFDVSKLYFTKVC